MMQDFAGTLRYLDLQRTDRRSAMKLSARNQLKGKIVGIDHGVTTTHVRIEVSGAVITAAITKTSAEELKLAVGRDAYAVIKASDVMVAVD